MNRARLKAQAKEIISTGQPSPIVFSVLYVAITIVIAFLSAKLVNIQIDRDTLMSFIESSDIEAFYDYIIARAPSPAAAVLDTLLQIMILIIDAGFAIFALNMVKGVGASLWNILDGFEIFLRVFWLSILEGIFVFLWSLLLFFPGIIALYSYRQAIYLLIEHPEMSAYQCLKESKRLMMGHKAELFVLDFSFIGWFLLSLIPVVSFIVNIWFAPYYEITKALYYRQLIYTPNVEPDGVTFD